jgi:hypothetical protein
MVEFGRGYPDPHRMAVFTGVRGLQMVPALARCNAAVVAAKTGSRYAVMIENRNLPARCAVARKTVIRRGDMAWRLSACLHAIVATRTGQRCHGMVKARNAPGPDLMAILAFRSAANVVFGLSGGDLAIVATETVRRGLGMIHLHNPPAASSVAVRTDVACRWMRAAFAGGRLAIMTGKAGGGRALEFCPCMAGFAADIEMLSAQRKARLRMIKGFVNDGIGRRRPGNSSKQEAEDYACKNPAQTSFPVQYPLMHFCS